MNLFVRTLSEQLDCLIYLIEAGPPWFVRLALRRWKASLEGGVR